MARVLVLSIDADDRWTTLYVTYVVAKSSAVVLAVIFTTWWSVGGGHDGLLAIT